MKKEAPLIPEDRMRTILARAAELDRAALTPDDLRAAALEAGISRAAVDQALEEFASAKPAATPSEPSKQHQSRWARWRSALKQAAVLAPISFAFGSLAGEDAVAALLWGAFVSASMYLIARDRPSRRAGIFQLHTAVMTAFATLGMSAFAWHQDAAMAFIGATGMGLFVIGTLIIKVRMPARLARLFVSTA